MADFDAPEPLERLLNLVGLLLESNKPLTFEQIRDTIEAYQGENAESVKRKFERDKDVLRDYGIPLALVPLDVWDTEQGYTIPKDEYYLPEIAFTPEEITALFLAGQSGSQENVFASGVRKLLYGADGGLLLGSGGGPLVAGSDTAGDRLRTAAEAAQRHARVRFGYKTSEGKISERDVDAFGVVYRGGRWYLVGHDHERAGIRAFRLSRLTTDLTELGEGASPPDDFSAVDHVEAGPWIPSGDEVAVVAFTSEAAVLASSAFPGAVVDRAEGGRVVLRLPMAGVSSMASVLLGYGAGAEVLEPPELRAAVIDRLEVLAGATG